MKIDDEIESFATQPPREREIVAEAAKAPRAVGDEQAIQMRVVLHDRCGRAFHQVPNGGVRICLPQGGNRRGGEHDIADQAKPNQQDLQGSTVASSINITGMSSLIGYTR